MEDFNCNDIDTDHSHFVGYHIEINLLDLKVKHKVIKYFFRLAVK